MLIHVYTTATTGGSTQPVPEFLANLCQKKALGCLAAAPEEVDLAKVYFAVYNRPAPTYPGTDRIFYEKALQELNFDINEYNRTPIIRSVGKIPGLNPVSAESQFNSDFTPTKRVEKAPAFRETSRTAALPEEGSSLQDTRHFARQSHYPWIIEVKKPPVTGKPLEEDPFFKGAEVPNKQNLAQERSFRELVDSAIKDFKPPKGGDDAS